jgi:hypothetical protein
VSKKKKKTFIYRFIAKEERTVFIDYLIEVRGIEEATGKYRI